MTDRCTHKRLKVEPCDQTIAVECVDCDEICHWCWADEHIPESLWNRACDSGPELVRCEQSRDGVCAICEGEIK